MMWRKFRCGHNWRIACLAGVLLGGSQLWLAGCDAPQTQVQETDERAFRRGQSLLKEGNNDEALAAFLSVIDARRIAPESHLEAGLLYLNHVRDPLSAIYHFRRYLEVRPNSEESSLVGELINTAQKEYLKQLPGKPYDNETSRLDLLAKVDELGKENERLRQQLVTYQSQYQQMQQRLSQTNNALEQTRSRLAQAGQPVAPIIISERQQEAPAATANNQQGPRSYTVTAGDSLSTISRKMYGTPNRWREIYEANTDSMASPNSLKVGQTLRIP
ncbi:MAG: LysM peptidoglycan-binding domain-containing protein [Verrucomicrobiota bacterium JB022]|nr:LysM peptidoglycan-binding domain-containing protein [Verrucomicrobiota bacterium JB022]